MEKKKTAEIFFAESDIPAVEKNFADFFFAEFFLRMRKFEKKILRNFFFADSGNPAVEKNFAEKKIADLGSRKAEFAKKKKLRK